MKKKRVHYNSNAVDILYLTGKRVWKEKLFIFEGKETFLEKREEIISYLTSLNVDEMGVDFPKISHKEFLDVQSWVPDLALVDDNPIRSLRKIKGPHEMELLKKSALLNQEAFFYLLEQISLGMTEKELSWLFEKYARERGASRMAFEATIAFGAHTASPHHRPTDKALQKGDPVVIDVGVVVNEYASDFTRSFSFQEERSLIGDLVLEAHQLALSLCKPGVSFLDIQERVDEFFKEKGVYHLRKHTLGHGVGLEVHEDPFVWSSDPILKEGMVITIEPGLYENGKQGYRHEDTIIITQEGFVNLYESRIWSR